MAPVDAALIDRVKQAHRAFPSGVTIVTALVAGRPIGLAVSAFSSVSMEPPTVLACVNSSSKSHADMCDAGHLGISVLSRTQSGVLAAFARSGGDKFRDVAWHQGRAETPLIDGAAATFEVQVVSRVEVGTHSVFFGEVTGVETSGVAPLVYLGGSFFDGDRLADP
ncbi:hypothetical protein LP52_02535 [Streptomonospora alba]|uniref:Flavin reductase like domain-containing protein n=1 Tax=Streptomonospora alba TaxID=183763 RepID=A0A0C2GA14_9ACTN|nr:flavin reductase family protein [Streptomonospora alba]KII00214.1 hypothetical protein LP52_02535 [Streptomonospora alba]